MSTKLKILIDSANISNYRLAKESNVGQATISELVSGKRKELMLSTAAKIAEALNVSIDEIYKCLEEDDDIAENQN